MRIGKEGLSSGIGFEDMTYLPIPELQYTNGSLSPREIQISENTTRTIYTLASELYLSPSILIGFMDDGGEQASKILLTRLDTNKSVLLDTWLRDMGQYYLYAEEAFFVKDDAGKTIQITLEVLK